MAEVLPPLQPGERIGPYRILSRLGRGGMATVYLAQAMERCPVALDRRVAVKVLTAPDDEDRKRFAREARYLSSLQHPGIVRVLDTGEDPLRAWFVMPLVQGRRLDELTDPGQALVDEGQILDLGIQILEALHVAHLAGILHRDLKPGNIMLEDGGRVRLLDFGLAAAPDRESRLTREGDVVGTPAYMAPEQASGRRDDIGRRTDLYAVGACLYELATGRQPFTGPNTMAVLRAVIDEALDPPTTWRPKMNRDLETVILVAMAKEPRDRYRTAEEMAGDLRLIRQGKRVKAHRLSSLVLFQRACWNHRRNIALGGLLSFIAVASIALMVREVLRQRKPATPGAVVEDHSWRVEQQLVPATPGAEPDLKWNSKQNLGPGLQLTALRPVDGAVRLGLTWELKGKPGSSSLVELLVTDRDVGAGYRLRLLSGANEDRLEMLRGDRVVTSQSLGRLSRPANLELSLEQDDGRLSGRLAGVDHPETVLQFHDLIPLSGGDTNGVFLARDPGRAKLQNIVVERQRGQEFVSALEKADSLRQERRWARALQLYENFLTDHGDSPQTRDALLCVGLCLEQLGDLAKALEAFERLIRENRDQPEYVLMGTCHAWTCQLRLGLYPEATASFASIRRDYDLPSLALVIPEDALREVRTEYQTRAVAQGAGNPDLAISLAFTAADLSEYLVEHNHQADALLLAGDLLLGKDRLDAARETYRRLDDDERIDPVRRVRALLGRAICERLQGDLTTSISTCLSALELKADTSRVRFWLGDALDLAGETAAAADQWKDAGTKDPLGRLCARLMNNAGPLPEADPLLAVPEGPYINARLIELSGGRNPATWLTRAAVGNTWGAALARARLTEKESAK